jgi:thiol-disulfide isomerase/thioredoxin
MTRCTQPAQWLLALLWLWPSGHSAAQTERAAVEKTPTAPVLHERNWKETERFIREKLRGKVVLVNIWTRTCPACVEDFPDFAGLQARFGREKFACLSVNCDYDGIEGKPPAYYRPGVEEFLKEQKEADRFEHVLLTDPLLDFMDAAKLNSTPAMFLYDGNGKLVRRFENDWSENDEFTIDDVAAASQRLLKSPSRDKAGN